MHPLWRWPRIRNMSYEDTTSNHSKHCRLHSNIMVVPVQVRLTIILLFLLALRAVSQLLQARLRLLWWITQQEHKDVHLVPKHHGLHLRLVLILLNKILTTYHQCNHQINFHHLLISQFHFHPHLLHPLMCQMHIQLLYQIFQQWSPLWRMLWCKANSNTTAITNALERMTTQFADALQQTIQMEVDAQAQENKNLRMDKQFEKVKIFYGSKPSECHPWLEEGTRPVYPNRKAFPQNVVIMCRSGCPQFHHGHVPWSNRWSNQEWSHHRLFGSTRLRVQAGSLR